MEPYCGPKSIQVSAGAWSPYDVKDIAFNARDVNNVCIDESGTGITPRKRYMDSWRADFLDPRVATATTRARARTRTVSSADRARARRGVVRRRDAGASNVDRKPYFLGFRKHGASSRRGSIRRRFFTFLSKFERFSSRFGVATRVKVQIDVIACDVIHRLVSTVRPLERRRRARDSR